MKLNFWLLCGTMLSTGLLAQQVTNLPPAAPLATPAAGSMGTNAAAGQGTVSSTSTASGTNAPAAKPAKKKAASKKTTAKKKVAGAELKTVPLIAGRAVVIASNVNVRGQAKLKSEVLGRLTKGQQVTVLEEITRNNSGPEEPSAWAKILLPASIHVWVNTAFIDATNKTVLPRRLNMRAGAGENYSVLGRLERGAPVTEIGAKGEWTEIEAPTNAYAFIAAQYLKQPVPGETPAAVALAESTAGTNATPAPPATTVAEAAPIVPATTEPPATPPSTEPPAVTNAPAESATTTNEPAPAVAEEPPPKRIVDREGIVRGTFSIQAPTHFELYSPETGRTIDWLYTPSPNLDLRRYKGLRIVVTGEEAIEERWGNTPVITIQKIQVLE
jgi:uncharacterized protein YgiM (DUF1202 family)